METGDLIYVILLLLFMILGFFNDSRKKKEQQKQQQQPNPNFSPEDREDAKSTPPLLSEDQLKKFELEKKKRLKQINREKEQRVKQGGFTFQSSMELTTDFKKESSIQSSNYINESDSLYDLDPEMSVSYDPELDNPEMPEVPGDTKYVTHPVVEELNGANKKKELVKGVVYSDILKRRY
ncbi:MAG: hypothetical protein PHV53_06685 [Fermentimonas sp.]|nr:hypothetical protein [Fermentimonas sp.]